jgi:hypothetical protein
MVYAMFTLLATPAFTFTLVLTLLLTLLLTLVLTLLLTGMTLVLTVCLCGTKGWVREGGAIFKGGGTGICSGGDTGNLDTFALTVFTAFIVVGSIFVFVPVTLDTVTLDTTGGVTVATTGGLTVAVKVGWTLAGFIIYVLVIVLGYCLVMVGVT